MFSHKYMCMYVCAKSFGKSFAKSCVASELSLLFSEDEDELLDLLDSSDSDSLVDFAFLFLLDFLFLRLFFLALSCFFFVFSLTNAWLLVIFISICCLEQSLGDKISRFFFTILIPHQVLACVLSAKMQEWKE